MYAEICRYCEEATPIDCNLIIVSVHILNAYSFNSLIDDLLSVINSQ